MRAFLTFLCALVAAGTVGCRTVPATQVLVFFHADDDTRATATSIRVRVTTASIRCRTRASGTSPACR